MNKKFSISTDTATLSIFDLVSLRHRINDDADWWSIPEDEIAEVNQGNVIFLNLGIDGEYKINICDEIDGQYDSLYLNIPSGKVFIGAGEDTSGGDLEPDNSEYISGAIVDLAPGGYELRFNKELNCINISFEPSKIKVNHITDIVRV